MESWEERRAQMIAYLKSELSFFLQSFALVFVSLLVGRVVSHITNIGGLDLRHVMAGEWQTQLQREVEAYRVRS